MRTELLKQQNEGHDHPDHGEAHRYFGRLVETHGAQQRSDGSADPRDRRSTPRGCADPDSGRNGLPRLVVAACVSSCRVEVVPALRKGARGNPRTDARACRSAAGRARGRPCSLPCPRGSRAGGSSARVPASACTPARTARYWPVLHRPISMARALWEQAGFTEEDRYTSTRRRHEDHDRPRDRGWRQAQEDRQRRGGLPDHSSAI